MINYKGKPLLGEDSSVSNTSEFFAIAGTILFWLIFLIFSFVIKPQPKKQYKEVQIVLSSTPVVQKSEEAPAPAEAASASAASSASEAVVETPVAEAPVPKSEPTQVKEIPKSAVKKTETQKPKVQPKNDAPKTQPKATHQNNVSEPDTYAMDMSGGIDFNSIKKKKNVDNSIFDTMNTDDNNSNTDSGSRIVNTKSSMTGTGGTSASGNPDKLKSESKTGPKTEESKHGSEIGNVRNAKEIGPSETGAGKNLNPSSGKDKNSVIWAEGTGARTYYNLDTELSQKAKSSMMVTKDTPFTITFSVDPDGNVMATTIEIKNEFILSDIIKKEMIEKISSWKFGKGSGISKAKFDWILRPGN